MPDRIKCGVCERSQRTDLNPTHGAKVSKGIPSKQQLYVVQAGEECVGIPRGGGGLASWDGVRDVGKLFNRDRDGTSEVGVAPPFFVTCRPAHRLARRGAR